MTGRGERPSKKMRKLSTDSGDDDSPIDWADSREKVAAPQRAEPARKKTETPRPRRGPTTENISTATVSRGPPSASSMRPTSLRLTVKTSSTKLQQATSSTPTTTTGKTISINSREKLDGGDIIEGKRSRNTRKSYVLESGSDEDEAMDDVLDDDAEEESLDEDEDMDAEGEEDADGDVDMDIPPPPPVITVSKAKSGKSAATAKPPAKPVTKTVEQKEAGSDDELSDLDSEVGDGVEEEEGMQLGDEEDAEGEDDDLEGEEDAEGEDEELDSDDETPMGGSRASTPDLNKLTKRQRARLEEGGDDSLIALPDEVQVKKHLTAEEHAMRRAEMARRRKNLSEKRNEEEKMETINKLLKKQAPKTNARRGAFNATGGESTPDSEQKPDPIFIRWVSNKDGNRIGVPEEWLEGPIGGIFGTASKSGINMGGKLIQEVE